MVDIAIDSALEAGYRHFDTAKYYVNEPELGNALEVITTLELKNVDLVIFI